MAGRASEDHTREQDVGSTPLDPDEFDDLIPQHLHTRSELNQWEALNIEQTHKWLGARKTHDVLSVKWLTELHRRMFDQTWRWAGRFRRSDKNISPYSWPKVPQLMNDLTSDIREQYAASGKAPDVLDMVAVRFHHRLVLIHPWANGNGRHARLATDELLVQWSRPVFWGGGADLVTEGNARKEYLRALRASDGGNHAPLCEFARS